jgi:hypothetical protein
MLGWKVEETMNDYYCQECGECVEETNLMAHFVQHDPEVKNDQLLSNYEQVKDL